MLEGFEYEKTDEHKHGNAQPKGVLEEVGKHRRVEFFARNQSSLIRCKSHAHRRGVEESERRHDPRGSGSERDPECGEPGAQAPAGQFPDSAEDGEERRKVKDDGQDVGDVPGVGAGELQHHCDNEIVTVVVGQGELRHRYHARGEVAAGDGVCDREVAVDGDLVVEVGGKGDKAHDDRQEDEDGFEQDALATRRHPERGTRAAAVRQSAVRDQRGGEKQHECGRHPGVQADQTRGQRHRKGGERYGANDCGGNQENDLAGACETAKGFPGEEAPRGEESQGQDCSHGSPGPNWGNTSRDFGAPRTASMAKG